MTDYMYRQRDHPRLRQRREMDPQPNESSRAMPQPEYSSRWRKFVRILIACAAVIAIIITLGVPASPIREIERREKKANYSLQQAPQSSTSHLSKNTAKKQRKCELSLPENVFSTDFYPKRFFQDGSGRPFLPFFETMVKNDDPVLNAVHLPRFITIARVLASGTKSTICESIYYHIHKCGGTTVKDAVISHNDSSTSTTKVYYVGLENRMGKKKFGEHARSTFVNAYEHQIDNNKTKLPVFTFVRDPLVRFLSGISQCMINKRCREDKYGMCFYGHSETVPMLDCVVQQIHDRQSYGDTHFQPQALEMYKATYDKDLAFQLINLKDIGPTIALLMDDDEDHNDADAMSPTTIQASRQRTPGLMLGKYNVTSTAILTPDLKTKICGLYAMDVIMLHESGIFNHTECDDELHIAPHGRDEKILNVGGSV